MKRFHLLLAIGLVTLATALTGLAGPAAAKPVVGDTATVADLVVNDPNFSTLVSLLEKAGLDTTLADPARKHTIFAPTNSAFRKLEKSAPGILAALAEPGRRKLLTDVLRYHLVRSDFSTAEGLLVATNRGKIATLLGAAPNARLVPGVKGGNLTLTDSSGTATATVIESDVQADNGAIQVVDRVLLPRSVAVALKKAGLLA